MGARQDNRLRVGRVGLVGMSEWAPGVQLLKFVYKDV